MSETSVSASAIFSARPTVRIAGQADARVDTLLTAMRMEESEGGLSTLELRLVDWVPTSDGPAEIAFNAQSALKLGAELQIGAGDATQPREIFRGKVSALEIVCEYGQAPELVVLAEDALTAARRARRTQVYTDMSPADVVNAVAGRLSLTPSVQGLSSGHGTWMQFNETDLAFLRRLVGRHDADLQVTGTSLSVTPRQDVDRGSIDLTMHGQLARVRITADLAEQVTAVTAAGWDAGAGNAVKHSTTSITHAGPGRGKSGPEWAQDAFGQRSEHLAGFSVASDEEASALTDAAFDQRARRFVCAEGTAEGNARLRVGAKVAISGVSAQFDNTYYVTLARHLYDLRQGYRTEFRAECAYLGNG